MDIASLRRFFMGVLGWTPATVMREATVDDLADAYLGFFAFHPAAPAAAGNRPSKQFLQAMLGRFPDHEGTYP